MLYRVWEGRAIALRLCKEESPGSIEQRWSITSTGRKTRESATESKPLSSVFGDARALTFSDTDHSEFVDRSRIYGISNKARLLVVVHTERRNGIRVIGARKATRYEKGIYENG